MEAKFLSFIQSILMIINNNENVVNNILAVIQKPNYRNILNLVGIKSINEQLCNIRKSLERNESLVLGMSKNIVNILKLSEMRVRHLKKKVSIEIRTPIVHGSWGISEMIPISLKRGSEVRKVSPKHKYIVSGDNHSYALISERNWKTCRKFHKRFFCKFGWKKGHSCESEMFFNQNISSCKLTPGKMPQIFRVNETDYYVNVDVNTTVVWRCNLSEHNFSLCKSAWIKISPGCQLRFQNGNYVSTSRWPGVKITIPIIQMNTSLLSLEEYNRTQKLSENSSLSLRPLLNEVNITIQKANKPIERIVLPTSNFIFYASAMCLIIVLLIIRSIVKK